MPPIFYHGEARKRVNRYGKEVKSLTAADLDPKVVNGDLCERWQHIMQWSPLCIKGKDLEPLRRKGDPLCDDAIEALNIGPHVDGLDKLETYVASHSDNMDPRVQKFWDQVRSLPSEKISASRDIFKPSFEKESSSQLSRGQYFFWQHNTPILTTLLHCSLSGGFASQRITSVLQCTGYLCTPGEITPASAERTHRRLFETTQMILDAMTDMTPLTGQGWRSCVRVRMLHSQVRRRVMMGKLPLKGSKVPAYNVEHDGIPINQEDLLSTLAVFSSVVLSCLDRLGLSPSSAQREDYIATWRHIGYYMGIEPVYLERFFATFATAEALTFSVMLHLLEPGPKGSPASMLTLELLTAISNRPPLRYPLVYHAELARYFLGDNISNAFSLPRSTSLWLHAKLHFGFLIMQVPILFGRYYRRGWDARRAFISHEIVPLLITWHMGSARTRFGYADGDMVRDESVEKMQYDRKSIRKLKYEFYGLMAEMGMVLFAVLVLGAYTIMKGYSYMEI